MRYDRYKKRTIRIIGLPPLTVLQLKVTVGTHSVEEATGDVTVVLRFNARNFVDLFSTIRTRRRFIEHSFLFVCPW